EKVLTTIDAVPTINGEQGKEKISWSLVGINEESLSLLPLSEDGERIAVAKKAEGKGYLVATTPNGVSSKCYVEIIDSTGSIIPLSRIFLDNSSKTLAKGETTTIKATPIPDNASDTSISWRSLDESIASVDSSGRVRGISEGTTFIEAYNSFFGVKARTEVTVFSSSTPELFPVSINLSTSYILLEQDKETPVEIFATVIASDGSVYSLSPVEWSIANNDIATIAADGNVLRVLPNNPGKTIVTARLGNISSSLLVVTGTREIPSETEIEKLFIVPSSAVVEIGKSQLLSLSSFPSGIIINPQWESSSSVVTIHPTVSSSFVYAKGEKEGNSVITASDSISKKTAESLITVMDQESIKEEITSIILDRTSITLDLNEKSMATINASVFVGGVLSDVPLLDWEYIPETGEKDAVVLYPGKGNHHTLSLSKNKIGSGYIKATNSESQMFALCYVKVIDTTDTPITLSGIKLSHSSISLGVGNETLLKAEAIPRDAAATILWSSSNEEIAIVTEGRVIAIKEGKTLIRAYSEENPNYYDECLVSVYSDQMIQTGSITLSSSILRVSMEEKSKTIEATVRDREGNIMPNAVVFWDTFNSDLIASFKSNGNSLEIFPLNSGTGTITAYVFNNSYERIEAEAKLIIGAQSEDKLISISFDSSDPIYVVAGEKKTVSVLYNPDKPNLKGVVWSSSSNTFSYSSDSSSVTLEGKKKGEGTLTATTINNPDGENISSSITVITVESEDEIPQVASLSLSRSAISFDLADKSLI
ncbi:MAG: Ig domain-containing protein, partial [Candidatus Ornithospirochaeta sp.]